MNRNSEVLALFLIACALAGPVQADEWFVRAGSFGAGTLDNPAGAIQYAITYAEDGDTIKVAEGTYSQPLFIVGKALVIEGGWNATFSERVPERFISVVDWRPSYATTPAISYVDAAGSLSGFTIKSNQSAIACFLHGASPSLVGNDLIQTDHNSIYCEEGSKPLITHNTMQGIYCLDSSPVISGNVITYVIRCDSSTPTIVGNTVSTGIRCMTGSFAVITGNTITEPGGYGITLTNGSSGLVNQNMVTGCAIGIFCQWGSSPVIANNLVVANGSLDPPGGGLFCTEGSAPWVIHNTFATNKAPYGGAIQCESGGSPVVVDCILWGNAARNGNEIALRTNSTMTIRYCCVAGGRNAAYIESGGSLTWGPGNLDTDPLFAAPGDYHLKSAEGRWNPNANAGAGGWVLDTVTSPCINGGDPASDWSKEPFPHGRRTNIGAYGNTAEASKAKWILPADADGNSRVDVLDLLFIRNRLGQNAATGDNWQADVNEDGKVNVLDLIFVRNRLGVSRP